MQMTVPYMDGHGSRPVRGLLAARVSAKGRSVAHIRGFHQPENAVFASFS